MKRFLTTTAAITTLAVTALGWAAAATAAAPNPADAQETVNALRTQGYSVQINGPASVPLSQCKVTGIEGMHNDNINSAGALIDPTKFTTVYVDVSCQDDA